MAKRTTAAGAVAPAADTKTETPSTETKTAEEGTANSVKKKRSRPSGLDRVLAGMTTALRIAKTDLKLAKKWDETTKDDDGSKLVVTNMVTDLESVVECAQGVLDGVTKLKTAGFSVPVARRVVPSGLVAGAAVKLKVEASQMYPALDPDEEVTIKAMGPAKGTVFVEDGEGHITLVAKANLQAVQASA